MKRVAMQHAWELNACKVLIEKPEERNAWEL